MTDAARTPATTVTEPEQRDHYIDFLRAFSLLVVVAWHWVFTIVVWKDDGPHATNPIGFVIPNHMLNPTLNPPNKSQGQRRANPLRQSKIRPPSKSSCRELAFSTTRYHRQYRGIED